MGYILDDDQTLIKYLEEKSDYENSLIKSVLLNLGFSQLEINTKKMNELSGGEATKLSIAKLLLEPSNVLILDEPTNFMDVYTIEALENLLMSYKGTVIFTTHDQAFVDKVATQVWEIKNARLQRI
ncbi:ATP-binding cassette domain-containing protein [Staphylococcus delphini]